MVSEEYSNKKCYFWADFSAFLASLPVIAVIACVILYYHGPSRASYIEKYNKQAAIWNDGGLQEFAGLTFNLTDSSGETHYREITQTSGVFYPVRDRCNTKQDPKGGCLYTHADFYNEDILWMEKDNYFTIEDSEGNVIRKEKNLMGSLNYTRDAKDLSCTNHADRCQERCDEMNGTWDLNTWTCNIQVFADSICYRLVKEDGKWVLDTKNSQKLPANKEFSMYPSDGLGCDYGNNWNSVHYTKVKKTDILMQLRSAKDSYIAASAYTRSCSNDYTMDAHCFGPARREAKYGYFIATHVCFGLIVLEILIGLVMLVLRRCAYKKAVRSNEQGDLLNQSI